MNPAIVSVLKRMQIEDVVIPAGDRAEQLVANLLLAIIASQVNSEAMAKTFVAQAHALAVGLANDSRTYHPQQPSKFARLTFNTDGEINMLLLSIINNIMVVPVFKFDDARGQFSTPVVANIVSLEPTHFMLRLRTHKTLSALESLKKTPSLELLADEAEKLLAECLYNEISSAEPFDRADDCITIARSLLKIGNFPLTSLALANAHASLDLCTKYTLTKHQADVVQTMRSEIRRMIDELRHTGI
jgi:hypothetical protein